MRIDYSYLRYILIFPFLECFFPEQRRLSFWAFLTKKEYLNPNNLNKYEPFHTSINATLIRQDAIISTCEKSKNRNGYFAAFYKNITIRIKNTTDNQWFEDNTLLPNLFRPLPTIT